MSTQGDRFFDATGDAADELEFPEVVAALEALGFTLQGRLGRGTSEALWREAAAYPKERRLDYCTHLAVPPAVLAASDGSAFVTVTWWWGMPDVRFRTVLSDGSVVETLRAWDRDPVWRRGEGAIRLHGDRRGEQLLANVPQGGRTVTLAEGSVGELWEAHRRSVAGVVADKHVGPVRHHGMPMAVAMSNRLARHQRACHGALVRRSPALWLLACTAVVIVLGWTIPVYGILLMTLMLVVVLLVLALRRPIRAWNLRRRYSVSGRPPLDPAGTAELGPSSVTAEGG